MKFFKVITCFIKSVIISTLAFIGLLFVIKHLTNINQLDNVEDEPPVGI